MIFPADFEKRLGFDQLRERLAASCLGEPGRRKVGDLRFLTDHAQITRLLQLSQEGMRLNETGVSLPIVPYADPESWRQALQVEGTYLELEDLAAAMSGFQAVVDANTFLLRDPEQHPTLSDLALPQIGRAHV